MLVIITKLAKLHGLLIFKDLIIIIHYILQHMMILLQENVTRAKTEL